VSYSTIATCAADTELNRRVISACVQEGHGTGMTVDYFWQFASAQDVEAAYASALAAQNPNPGSDETVVTDGMILAYVQAKPPVLS
jgi:hypothetical protein